MYTGNTASVIWKNELFLFSVDQGFDSQQQLLHQNSRKGEIVIKTSSNLSNSPNLKSDWQPNKQLLRGSKELAVGHFYGS